MENPNRPIDPVEAAETADSIEDTRPTPAAPLVRRRTSVLVALMAAIVSALWLIGTPAGVMGKAIAVGYAICHRITVRSFLIDGAPMPLCARCTGIYLGVMTGLIIAAARGRLRAGRLPPLHVVVILVGFVGLLGIDGLNSYGHLFPGFAGIYEPHNILRLITGLLCGVAISHLILPVLNSSVWARPGPARSLDGLRDLVGVLAVTGVVALLVLGERPVILWVLGVLSSAGVVVLLCMIGMVLFLTVARLDRQARTWRDLVIPLLAGMTLCFIQLGGITIVRFALTGTWDGFSIG